MQPEITLHILQDCDPNWDLAILLMGVKPWGSIRSRARSKLNKLVGSGLTQDANDVAAQASGEHVRPLAKQAI